jgi:hypothetical protein
MSCGTVGLVGPDAPDWVALDQLVRLLREYPLLVNMVGPDHVFYPDGSPEGVAHPDNLPLPFVRVDATRGAGSWATAGKHKFSIDVSVEIGTLGHSKRDVMKVWSAVLSALGPHGDSPIAGKTNMQVLQDKGILQVEFEAPAYQYATPEQADKGYAYAEGLLRIEIRIPT